MFDDLIKDMRADLKETKIIAGAMKPAEAIGATVVFTLFMLMLLVLPMMI